MTKARWCILFIVVYVKLISQGSIPENLQFQTFTYLDKENVKCIYDFTKHGKKAFLFYDMGSESMAEVMYNGTNFVFGEKRISVFPVYFSGQLTKSPDVTFNPKIPTQVLRSPETSIFKDFGLKHDDFPLVVIYNEKNELCGVSKDVQSIASIDCGTEAAKIRLLRLKIMVENKDKSLTPYSGKDVTIIGEKKNDTVAKLITNKYGDFNVELTDINQNYLITVNESNKNVKFVVLGTQSGKVVGRFNATDKGFVYRLLETELSKLPEIAEDEELELKLTNMNINNLKDFVITETLYYELGESKLSQGSKELIENIKKVLDKYPDFKVSVISHTDSQGDDNSNLKLSVKRSETVIAYLHTLGVESARLNAQGKGELEIRNRCLNGIDCSDKEHEYNRRTDFKFSKK